MKIELKVMKDKIKRLKIENNELSTEVSVLFPKGVELVS